MWWGRRDGRERRVLGQILADGRGGMCTGGGGRLVVVVVREGAEDKVCLVDGVGDRVRGLRVTGVGVGVCMGVRLGMRQCERLLGGREHAGSSDRVYGLRVVQAELRARGWLGVRRKGGRTAHHHVAVPTR